MSSNIQLASELPSAIPPGSAPGKARLFRDVNDGGLKFKDNTGAVFSVAGAGDYKQAVRFVSSAALPAYTRIGNTITANANGTFPTQDGVTPALNDGFLYKDGAGPTAADNGLWVITQLGSGGQPFVIDRRGDLSSSSQANAGSVIPTGPEGTLYGSKLFILATANPITLNTTPLAFAMIGGGGALGTVETITGGAAKVIPANEKMIQTNALDILDGDLEVDGNLEQIDTDRNYTEKVIPLRTKRIVPQLQQMVFGGTLQIDGTLQVDGTLYDAGPPGLQTQLDAYLPNNTMPGRLSGASAALTATQIKNFLGVSDLVFGTTVHNGAFTAEIGKINLWDGTLGAIATLPTTPVNGDTLAFLEANGAFAAQLQVNWDGVIFITSTGGDQTSIFARGASVYTYLKYDGTSNRWKNFGADQISQLIQDTNRVPMSQNNGMFNQVQFDDWQIILKQGPGNNIVGLTIDEQTFLGRNFSGDIAALPQRNARNVIDRWQGGFVQDTVTGTVNDFAPLNATAWRAALVAELAQGANAQVTGFDASGVSQPDFVPLKFIYGAIGPGSSIAFLGEDTGSTATNRLHIPRGEPSYPLSSDEGMWIWYDTVIQRWRLLVPRRPLETHFTATVHTSGVTARKFERVLFDSTGWGGGAINAPSAPERGDTFGVKNVSADTTDVQIATPGPNIQHPRTRLLVPSFFASEGYFGADWQFDGTTWLLIAAEIQAEGIRANNGNASPITVGQAVYVLTSAGPEVDLAKADNATTAQFSGIVSSATIGNGGAAGIIQYGGAVYNVPAAIYDAAVTAGDRLYLSPTTAGNLTNVIPSTSGQFIVPIGVVLDASNPGSFLIEKGPIVEIP